MLRLQAMKFCLRGPPQRDTLPDESLSELRYSPDTFTTGKGQRDLTLLVEKLVALLALGYTSDTQVKTLFNYIVQCGGAARASAFFREMAERSPKHKEELMTLAEQLHEEGRVEGLQIGRQEGRRAEALRIAQSMLANGLDSEAVMTITGLSADDLQTVAH